MRPVLFALALGAAVAAPVEARPKVPKIEGTTFALHVETGEKTDARGEKSFEEVVSFGQTEVSLETCAKRGYSPSPFRAKLDGDKWLIEFDQTSPADGKMSWKGDLRDDWFKGVMLWTKTDGKVRNFWFKGQLVKEGKKKK